VLLCRLVQVALSACSSLLSSSTCVDSGFCWVARLVVFGLELGRRLAVWLKKEEVGKYISSVLDFVGPEPMCISSPRSLKVSLMMLIPLTMSFLVMKMNDPLSR